MKIVIPATRQDLVERCLRSLTVCPADIIVVDNTRDGLTMPFTVGRHVHVGRNLGVARSWNIGVRYALTDGEPLTICSQFVEFGETGGHDLGQTTDEWGCEYDGFAWHLNTFTVKFMQTFGFFDENFWPAYYEDTDALYRMGLLGIPSPRENGRTRPYAHADATCLPNGQAIADGSIYVPFESLKNYYRAKWGGNQGEETYRTAFEDHHGVNWWPGVRLAGTW